MFYVWMILERISKNSIVIITDVRGMKAIIVDRSYEVNPNYFEKHFGWVDEKFMLIITLYIVLPGRSSSLFEV